MGKKYEHLERLREKIASRASNKKVSSALASLWLEFDSCLSQFKPSCRENDEVIKKYAPNVVEGVEKLTKWAKSL